MNLQQVKVMMRLAREAGNFKDMERLQKIMKFQNPNFRYPSRSQRRLFGQNFWEIAIKNNKTLKK